MAVDLSVSFAGVQFANPVFSASGTYGHGLEMSHFVSPAKLGALVGKTVTRRPRPGNAPPRMAETPSGMLNSIGLENRGIEHYRKEVLPTLRGCGTRVISNIGAESIDDFAFLAEQLDSEDGVSALEVNLSCPNVGGGKLPFSTDCRNAEAAIRAVRERTRKPILAKLSPNVTSIAEIARAVEAAGADGITAINTLLGMAIDWRRRAPMLSTTVGGLSGPAIKPVALRMVFEVARAVRIPVVAAGGVRCADDVAEFLVAGASAVQVGTWNFVDPTGIGTIVDDLERILEAARVASVRSLIGSLRSPAPVRFEQADALVER
ncbi:MAG: dihydroorotate dehydrogenase [Planctomycetes bacterium]|nr:dihydroorotate dehydrogenase [Planctomycetota bacterium]